MSLRVDTGDGMGDSNRRRFRGRSVLVVSVAVLVGVVLAAVSLSTVVVTTPIDDGAVVTTVGERADRPTAPQSASGQSVLDRETTARSGPEFDATVFRDVAGQVATEDAAVAVRGTATGTDRVLAVLFDRRGRVVTELLPVDDDGTFEEDDLRLVTADGTPLAEGLVVATVLSPGRDGRVGDGSFGDFAGAGLADLEATVREWSAERFDDGGVARTQRQLVERFYNRTVEAAGSDDLLLAEEFVYTDGRTTVERVFPASQERRTGADGAEPETGATGTVEALRVGDTMVVQGLTNRKPDDNTIFVTVVEGPSADSFDLYATQTWGTDGVWRVEIDAAGVEPGVYTVEADDGDSADRFEVRVLPRENATASVRGHRRDGFGDGLPERAVIADRNGGNEPSKARSPSLLQLALG
jgi:major cell surface glycoprotein (TIGR04216 family)